MPGSGRSTNCHASPAPKGLFPSWGSPNDAQEADPACVATLSPVGFLSTSRHFSISSSVTNNSIRWLALLTFRPTYRRLHCSSRNQCCEPDREKRQTLTQ